MTTMVRLLSFAIISAIFSSIVEAKEGMSSSFGAELIHKEISTQPRLNSSHSRLQSALEHTTRRAAYYRSVGCSRSNPEVKVIPDRGNFLFLMKISLGTPPTEFLAVADTGSDLIWTPCQPCPHCQTLDARIFNPFRSSSYAVLSCNSSACPNELIETSCDQATQVCQYMAMYGDNSITHGELATDTLTLGLPEGPKISQPNVIMGCAQGDSSSFTEYGHGLVGLGRGSLSMISQLNSSIAGKFSYCLVPMFDSSLRSSKMTFGDKAVVSGYGVVTTPLINSFPLPWYCLKLEAISVGGTRLEFLDSEWLTVLPSGSNIVIDSGAILTTLPTKFYNRVEAMVRSIVKFEPLPSHDNPRPEYSLCYDLSRVQRKNLPVMVAHFRGADLVLNPINTFLPDDKANIICLGMEARDDFTVFGSLAQQNFLIGYDLTKNTVSFKPTDCTK